MATFVCKYVDERRGVLTLELEAPSRSEAISQLRSKGKPISIEEKVVSVGSTEITLFEAKKIKTKDISLFCKQMSVMIDAGIPLNNAVDILEQQATSKILRSTLKNISKELKEGSQLSVAMKKQDDLYPELLINMIEAGEKTGKLDEVLEKMSIHYTKEVKINSQIKGAMIYPIILLVMVVFAVVALLYFVVPSFKSIFDSSGTELPLPTRMVLGASNWLQSYWYILLAIVVGGGFAFNRYSKTETGRYQIDSLKLSLPLLRGPMQKIVTARFSSTLATLTSAGIPLVDALEAAASTTNNARVMDKVADVSEGIQQGMRLTDMIQRTEIFPLMMLSMVKIGEESGSLETMLIKTSDYYEEELEAAIKQLLAMMEPALIIIMGVLVGGIVASIMLPMFGLASAVEAGASSTP